MKDDKRILDGLDSVSGGVQGDDFCFDVYCDACGHVVAANLQGRDMLDDFLAAYRSSKEMPACPKCGQKRIIYRQV